MITSVSIERLRGIKQGELTDLTPLTVLLGPNGCGKSTVLDAMYIGAVDQPWQALRAAATRHQGMRYPLPWVFWKQGYGGNAQVRLERDAYQRAVVLSPPPFPYPRGRYRVDVEFRFNVYSGGFGGILGHVEYDDSAGPIVADGEAFTSDLSGLSMEPVRLVDPAIEDGQAPLYDLFMVARQTGRRAAVNDLVAAVTTPDAALEIGTEGDQPILHIATDDGTVPVALSGEGIRALTRTALELAAAEGGTLLLEEPEVHQHPATMALCAKAIVAGVARGVQVVVSTHSLELVDYLIEACGAEHLDKLSVYNLALRDGVLSYSRRTGDEAKFAREGMEWDLR